MPVVMRFATPPSKKWCAPTVCAKSLFTVTRLAGCLAMATTLAACTGHAKNAAHQTTPAPASSSQPGGSPLSSPAPAPSSSSPAAPIAQVTGQVPDLTLSVLDVRRDGEVATLDFTLTSAQGAKPVIQPYSLVDPQSHGNDFSGSSLVDVGAGKRYLAVFDTAGDCLCSKIPYNDPLWSGKAVRLYVEFPAPPSSTTKVQVDMPTFPPIDNVPITDES